MGIAAKIIKLRYDGRCFVPLEPVDMAPETEIRVIVQDDGPTWVEKRFGIPRLVPLGTGPSSEEIINEQRGAY